MAEGRVKLFMMQVLPFVTGGFAVGHGMLRTMVVATETHCAVIAPRRAVLHGDVVQRTCCRAFSAPDACVFRMEFFAAHQEAAEEAAKYVRLCPGQGTGYGHVLSATFFQNHPADVLRGTRRLPEFFCRDIVAVHVKSRQTYVCVWHLNSIGPVEPPAFRRHKPDNLCLSGTHVISASAGEIGIVVLVIVQRQAIYELPDNVRHVPAVYREYKSNALMFSQSVTGVVASHGFANGDKSVVCHLLQAFRKPQRVACT